MAPYWLFLVAPACAAVTLVAARRGVRATSIGQRPNGVAIGRWPARVNYDSRLFDPKLYEAEVGRGWLGVRSRRRSFIGEHFYPQWWFQPSDVAVATASVYGFWNVSRSHEGIALSFQHQGVQHRLEVAVEDHASFTRSLTEAGFHLAH